MSETAEKRYQDLILPPSVVSKSDVMRLVSEVEQLDLLTVNGMKIDDERQRSELISLLRQLKDNAPVIHMTFATTADQESLSKIADWLRQSIHPQSLMVIGLQPDLVGGVYIRTPNHVHDLSLRAQLAKSRHLLVEAVEAVNAGR
jgi:F0F1-type ATP synthase delta subunit